MVDGKPEGIISNANFQNFKFDYYPDDFKVKGLKFCDTDDGSIFFKADLNMSLDEILESLKIIALNSPFLQAWVGFDGYDEDDDDINIREYYYGD